MEPPTTILAPRQNAIKRELRRFDESVIRAAPPSLSGKPPPLCCTVNAVSYRMYRAGHPARRW